MISQIFGASSTTPIARAMPVDVSVLCADCGCCFLRLSKTTMVCTNQHCSNSDMIYEQPTIVVYGRPRK